jgi:hypothetical protein
MPVLQGFLEFSPAASLFFSKITLILANNRETGSYLTAPTTIQSPQTRLFGVDAK